MTLNNAAVRTKGRVMMSGGSAQIKLKPSDIPKKVRRDRLSADEMSR